MKIAVICAPGVGDALILQIASHHLSLAGHEVIHVTPHDFGRWLPNCKKDDAIDCDAIFLQHDNSTKAEEIRQSNCAVYTFYGSHHPPKHGALKAGFDYVCNPDQTMVDNVVAAIQILFHLPANKENGLTPFGDLIHRKHIKRVVIHTTSGDPNRNWPEKKFIKVAKWLDSQGFEPCFLPLFPNLEDLISFIYESGYFIGNDSGPGHIASCLKVPYLVIGREKKHMRHWRPDWGCGEVVTPPNWVPNWKGFRMRERKWKSFITINKVTKKLKSSVLKN